MAKSNKKGGLNKDKVEKVMENVSEILADEVTEPIVEPTVEEIVEPIVTPIVDESIEETTDIHKLHHIIKILNINISNAITFNKDKSTKGITGTQLKAIVENYKRVTSIKMTQKQIDYIKKVNFEQARSIIYTINLYGKKLRQEKELREREEKVLATNE